MSFIGLYCPAIISLKLYLERCGKEVGILQTVIKYCIYLLINNVIVQVVITYVLNVSDVTVDAFNSFPFATKYIGIAIIISIIVPFIEELMKKYFKISIETGVYNDKKNDQDNKSSNK